MILVWRTPVLQGRGIAPKCRPPEVFPFIKSLHNREKTLFARQMLDAVCIIPPPSPLEAVAIIGDMGITAQNRDTRGDNYENLLSQLSAAGKSGQFRTLPHHLPGAAYGSSDILRPGPG